VNYQIETESAIQLSKSSWISWLTYCIALSSHGSYFGVNLNLTPNIIFLQNGSYFNGDIKSKDQSMMRHTAKFNNKLY